MSQQAFFQGFQQRWTELEKQAKIHYPKPPVDNMSEYKKRLRMRRSARNASETQETWLKRVTDAHPGKLQPTTSGRHRP